MVTAQLFLDVLQGNASAVDGLGSGKVLKSDQYANVFVNFVDHGGAGIVAFPNGPYLHAADLNTALENMHAQKMYNKLVFYLEACNSGSMFAKLLPSTINIYATTASNPSEPSWGTYCPPLDKVDGKSVGSCLGDLYSVNWLEDSDTTAGQARTLDAQFAVVKQETNKSHCMEYGTVDGFDATDHVSDFQGHAAAAAAEEALAQRSAEPKDAVDSRDIELVTDFYAYLRAAPEARSAAASNLLKTVEGRERADATFSAVIKALRGGEELNVAPAELHACHKGMYTAVYQHCGGFDSYSLKFSKALVDMCESRSLADIKTAIAHSC